ncbi:MAG: diguanylate cyclase [Gallionellaceae bacterium]|nr:MAG: diguanylate cyclase [Gallionellaceae bacterium]
MNLRSKIFGFWHRSIRGQLIAGFSLAALVLLVGFGYLLLKQQRDFLHHFGEERTESLAHALSIGGTSWVLANDLVGLQEVVQGFATTPDLQRAYFLNTRGEVLASTKPEEIGFFVTDPVSRDMLASTSREAITLTNQHMIVVSHPVIAGGRHLGWLRIEMTRHSANTNMGALTKTWLEFMIFAVLSVSLMALMLAHRLTRGLNHLMHVAAEVEHGRDALRADIGREDEIGVLARHLNRMLDAIEKQRRLVYASEAKYRFLADHISDVIWIMNIATNRWEYMSPSVKNLLGYTADEAMSLPLEKTLTAKSHADIQNWIAERGKLFLGDPSSEHVYMDELEQRCRDGSTVWTEVTAHLARNDSGELILLGVTRNISERKKTEEKIRNLAFYDTLTKLPNRRLLFDRLGLARSASKRSGRYAALMFIDLDNFKPLNDKHGHDIGDLLLIEVARRIGGCVREGDTVARFGGDEFIVILGELTGDRDASILQAGGVAEKIRSILAEPYVLSISKEGDAELRTIEHHCTSSIGVVLFLNNEGSPDDIIKCADTAMYRAKEAGRNQICFSNS